MAVSFICGFEMGSTGEPFLITNAPTVQSTTARSGTYALQCNTTSTTASVTFEDRTAGGTLVSFGRSVRCYIRISSLPNANTNIITVNSVLGGPANAIVRLNTDGTLSILSGANVRGTSSQALSADNLWHRLDFDVCWSSNTGLRLFIDGAAGPSDTTDTFNATATSVVVGVQTSATANLFFDDVIIHDSVLPSNLSDYNVNILLPVSDNAAGGWKRSDGSTGTALFDAVNNQPPTGTTSAVLDTDRIQNAVSSATDNYDANCATYGSLAGLIYPWQVLAIQAVCNDSQAITTGSPKAGAVVVVSNPTGQAERSFDFGLQNGTAGSTVAAAMATFPTGWGTHWGPITENPIITVGSAPVIRVGKRVASTRVVDVDFMGMYVVWQPTNYTPRVIRQAVVNSVTW